MKNRKISFPALSNEQSASVLLAVTFEFLRRNAVPKQFIVSFAKQFQMDESKRQVIRKYRQLQDGYESMGVIMATWFSNPQFLDHMGRPIPLSLGRGMNSLKNLIRVSRTRTPVSLALKLMGQSPSIKFDAEGRVHALKRVFVLPELGIPRAAFVIERYLETIERNASARKRNSTQLLERSCHVSRVDFNLIAPLLRDIESRGAAFMDLLDGEIEERRLRGENTKSIGEMGVCIFAYAKRTRHESSRVAILSNRST